MFKIKNIAVLFTVLAALGLSGDVWGMNGKEIEEKNTIFIIVTQVSTIPDNGMVYIVLNSDQSIASCPEKTRKLKTLLNHPCEDNELITAIKNKLKKPNLHITREKDGDGLIRKTFEGGYKPSEIGTYDFDKKTFNLRKNPFIFDKHVDDKKIEVKKANADSKNNINIENSTKPNSTNKIENSTNKKAQDEQQPSRLSTMLSSSLSVLNGIFWGTIWAYWDRLPINKNCRTAVKMGTIGGGLITTGLCARNANNKVLSVGAAITGMLIGKYYGKPVVDATCTKVKKLF